MVLAICSSESVKGEYELVPNERQTYTMMQSLYVIQVCPVRWAGRAAPTG